MPTILKRDGFRFFFYSADWNEPMHVHAEGAGGQAKFWLRPLRLATSYRMKSKDMKRARLIIEAEQSFIEEKWNEYFSGKN